MALRYAIAKYLSNKVEERARREVERHKELYDDLMHYREHSPSTGCSFSDYRQLYAYIRAHRPKEVLECGTGLSTVVIARALEENERDHGIAWRLVSMEENPSYYEAALKSMPTHWKGHPRIEMVLSEAVEDTYEFFRGVRYKEVPKGEYDFVFVDGPDFMINPTRKPLTFDYDLVKLVAESERPIAAFVDTRMSTSFVYSMLFPGKFHYDYLRRTGIVSPVTRHDLADARAIVSRAMVERRIPSSPLAKLITGNY